VNLSALWEDLAGRALLGTTRGSALPGLPAPWTPLEAPEESPSRRLATRLAGLSLARRAGFLAPTSSQTVPEAPIDERPWSSGAATRVLDHLLAEDGALDLLSEWLDLCHASGRRPPHAHLPDLVAAALQRPDLARRLRTLVPAQLEWWCGVEPRARRLTPPPANPDEAWDSPEPVRRVEALRLLRRRDPADARERLRAAWKGESAETRASLVETLAEGLGQGDEEFLEGCLDDRSKGVRAAAAETLAGLDGSALVQRLRARLSSSLRLERSRGFLGMGRSLGLEVELPPAADASLERDLGIGPNPGQKPSPAPAGERARLLLLLVARGGLAWWRSCAAAPREILEAVARTEFAEALVHGLSEATARARDTDWAEALLETPQAAWQEALLDILPAPRRQALLLARLREGDARAFGTLSAEDGPWDAPRTRALLDHAWADRASWREPWRWRSFLPLATAGDLATLSKDLPRWRTEEVPEGLSRLLVQRIELRLELHTAFAKEASP